MNNTRYNRSVEVELLPDRTLTAKEAVQLQRKLADRVSRNNEMTACRYVGGVDISVNRRDASGVGAVVILNFPALTLVECSVARVELTFPYIPGLLSFRELPVLYQAFKKLSVIPDVIMVDGQGIAHPRRFGLASHLGVLLDIPTVGCAKSVLCGEYSEPDSERGSYSEMIDRDEVVGAAVRTKNAVKPVYISIGHRTDLPSAIKLALECCTKYRLPEPTRLAHQAAGGTLKWH